ncbi:alpha/beta fold hydrolase [Microbacterium sp. NPDC090003]|uniref:alpha/beta fold hydrolase n=1 Tax=Microbacterium sp. NPDC090003 TaxID=3364203 RepID=UPI00382D1716
MLLHAEITPPTGGTTDGASEKDAASIVLLHGLMGSTESWHDVVPHLAASGWRVIAIDLPGHGRSPRDPELTVARAAASVVQTVRAHTARPPFAALGHSYGGTVLAAAAPALEPRLAVFIDSALAFAGHADRASLTAQYVADAGARTVARLRERPGYSAASAEREARAARLFDPATSASISCGADVDEHPPPGSIAVIADPSRFVPPAAVSRWQAADVEVRRIPGAAHTPWYGRLDDFVAALPEVFDPRPPGYPGQ